MNRKDYEEVKLEIVRFDAEDVIVTSIKPDSNDETPTVAG